MEIKNQKRGKKVDWSSLFFLGLAILIIVLGIYLKPTITGFLGVDLYQVLTKTPDAAWRCDLTGCPVDVTEKVNVSDNHRGRITVPHKGTGYINFSWSSC